MYDYIAGKPEILDSCSCCLNVKWGQNRLCNYFADRSRKPKSEERYIGRKKPSTICNREKEYAFQKLKKKQQSFIWIVYTDVSLFYVLTFNETAMSAIFFCSVQRVN